MLGTMMDFPLTLQHIFERGTRLFPDREIVTGGLGGMGRLPGDIFIHRGNSTFYFPIVTCLLISAVLTLRMWLFRR